MDGRKDGKDGMRWSSLVNCLLRATSVLTKHWCLAANLRIAIFKGEMVFNRLLVNALQWLVESC